MVSLVYAMGLHGLLWRAVQEGTVAPFSLFDAHRSFAGHAQ